MYTVLLIWVSLIVAGDAYNTYYGPQSFMASRSSSSPGILEHRPMKRAVRNDPSMLKWADISIQGRHKPVKRYVPQDCEKVPKWLRDVFPLFRCNTSSTTPGGTTIPFFPTLPANFTPGLLKDGEFQTANPLLAFEDSDDICHRFESVYSEIMNVVSFALANLRGRFIAHFGYGVISFERGTAELNMDTNSMECISKVINEVERELIYKFKIPSLKIHYQFSLLIRLRNRLRGALAGTMDIQVTNQQVESRLTVTKQSDGLCKLGSQMISLNFNITGSNYKASFTVHKDKQRLRKRFYWAKVLNSFVVRDLFLREDLIMPQNLTDFRKKTVATVGYRFKSDTKTDFCEIGG